MNIVDPPYEFDQPTNGLHVTAFGAPRGYSSGEIGTARFLVDRQQPRFPTIHTYWAPSEAELEQLQRGAVVQFSMVTQVPPPVSAGVYMPAEDPRMHVASRRCETCGHWMDVHGRSGCAEDDEAAMSGCDCPRTAEEVDSA